MYKTFHSQKLSENIVWEIPTILSTGGGGGGGGGGMNKED